MPKVSVIMACRNAAPFIERAIASVVNQTFSDLELIIVDDASQDESLLLARQAGVKDSRIQVCSLTRNVGAGAARNIAIARARGEWLAVLDADDVFLPEKIECQVKIIRRNSTDIVLIGTDSFIIDIKGQRLSLQKYPSKNKPLKENLMRGKRFPAHSSLMYKTQAVSALNGFNNRYLQSEDCDLWLRLIKLGSFALVPTPMVEYRLHTSNISKSKIGFSHNEYGIAARVCHSVRMRNYPDPSNTFQDTEWTEFMEWIAGRLKSMDVPQYLQIKNEWRDRIYARHSTFEKIRETADVALSNPRLAIDILSEKLFGTTLPQHLANEWIKKRGM